MERCPQTGPIHDYLIYDKCETAGLQGMRGRLDFSINGSIQVAHPYGKKRES